MHLVLNSTVRGSGNDQSDGACPTATVPHAFAQPEAWSVFLVPHGVTTSFVNKKAEA